jgi:hypothetical protein
MYTYSGKRRIGAGDYMKVRYIKDTTKGGLTNGKIYEVISVEKDWYRIIDDTDEDFLYPPEVFEVIRDGEKKQCGITL